MAAKSVYLCNYSYFSWKISSREAGLVQQRLIVHAADSAIKKDNCKNEIGAD